MSYRKLTCAERDEILLDPGTGGVSAEWVVASSCTDTHGVFGAPRIETTWERDGVQVQDVRYPEQDNPGKDARPCEHYEVTREESLGDENA